LIASVWWGRRWVLGAVVALIVSGSGAARADEPGSACCGDLEARIAELEETTARKGNRRVSLTVSGYAARELTQWDDGVESNLYEHGLGPTQATNVRFSGQAAIAAGWTAGYMLRLQDLSANPFGRSVVDGQVSAMNQMNDDFNTGVRTQMSYFYLQSQALGKVSVGLMAHAAKSAAMFTDLSGTQIFDNYTFLDGFPQFVLRSGGDLAPPVTWGQLAFCYGQNLPLGGDCNGIVMNGVRYDTPTFAGFSASASWGEDDFWEGALRYGGEVAGFKLAFAAGYSSMSDERATGPRALQVKSSDYAQVGGYVQHVSSGLFVHAAYGREDNNGSIALRDTNGDGAGDTAVGPVENGSHWYVKAGIRARWTALGTTIVYGDLAEYQDQLGPAALAQGATGSEFLRGGGGIAQEIDAAAMTIYLKYQHYEADVTGAASLADLDDLELVSAGAIVQF